MRAARERRGLRPGRSAPTTPARLDPRPCSETECIIIEAGRNGGSEGDARVVRTRAALRGALVELLSEQAFEALTVREIAGRAGVGYATFFRRYRDKEALLFEVADHLNGEILAVLLPSLERRDTAATARALCAFVRERDAVCRAVLAGGAQDLVRGEAVRRALARVAALRPDGPVGVEAELAMFHSVSAVLTLLSWWLRTHAEVSAEAMAQAIDRLVLAPATRWSAEREGV